MLQADGRFVSIFELEPLEIRRFLTTASLNGTTHTLTITGTSGNDTITLSKQANGKVSITGVAAQFTPGGGTNQFNKIVVNAGSGNDKVQIANNFNYSSASLNGQGGNDSLTGGNNNDTASGGDGNDLLD